MTVQMFKRRLLLQGAGLMAGLAASGLAWGQFQVDILGVGANQFPIAVQPFENESACPEIFPRSFPMTWYEAAFFV